MRNVSSAATFHRHPAQLVHALRLISRPHQDCVGLHVCSTVAEGVCVCALFVRAVAEACCAICTHCCSVVARGFWAAVKTPQQQQLPMSSPMHHTFSEGIGGCQCRTVIQCDRAQRVICVWGFGVLLVFVDCFGLHIHTLERVGAIPSSKYPFVDMRGRSHWECRQCCTSVCAAACPGMAGMAAVVVTIFLRAVHCLFALALFSQ